MTRMIPRLGTVLAFSTLLATGCPASVGSGNSVNFGSAAVSEADKAGVSQLAAKTGISENYVGLALGAARSAFGSSDKSADAKTSAVSQGVDKAAAQATTDGKPLTDDQKAGLTAGLGDLIGQ